MTQRILGESGSRRRRRWLVLPVLATTAFALFWIAGASAVHNIAGGIELEGGTDGSNAVTDNQANHDWDQICKLKAGDPACASVVGTAGNPTGASFENESPADASSIYTGGGSKDDKDISGWRWKDGGGLPDKDNLLHSFAARYTISGTKYLYFGADRFANSGDAQIGFWFLQGNVGNQAGGTFGPDAHKKGDILVLSDFTNGGVATTIRVFLWDPAHLPASELVDGTLLPIAGGLTSDARCGVANPDDFCANVNNVDGVTAPWSYTNKEGANTFGHGELYEGGINLTALNAIVPGIANECFASFVAETRSSQSVDAVLKDFTIGSFEACQSGIVTTPQNSTITLGGSNTDTAVVTGTGAGTPTGKVQFFICSPSELTGGQCKAPSGTQVIKAGSDATGEPLGPSPPPPATPDPTKAEVTSGAYTPPSVAASIGTWCWRGVYKPAAGSPYAEQTDDSTGECFTVTQLQPLISTAQTMTLKDSATISLTGGGTLSGTLRFRLYTSNDCTTGLVYDSRTANPNDIAVSGASPQSRDSGVVSFTSTQTNLSWLVEYTSSDAGQKNVASVCDTEHSSLTIVNGS
jgi:hypothetical protein